MSGISTVGIDQPRFLSVEQLARVLDTGENQVRAGIKAGLLPGYYIATPGFKFGKYLIPVEAVERWLRGEPTVWTGHEAVERARALGDACASAFLRSFGDAVAAIAGQPEVADDAATVAERPNFLRRVGT